MTAPVLAARPVMRLDPQSVIHHMMYHCGACAYTTAAANDLRDHIVAAHAWTCDDLEALRPIEQLRADGAQTTLWWHDLLGGGAYQVICPAAAAPQRVERRNVGGRAALWLVDRHAQVAHMYHDCGAPLAQPARQVHGLPAIIEASAVCFHCAQRATRNGDAVLRPGTADAAPLLAASGYAIHMADYLNHWLMSYQCTERAIVHVAPHTNCVQVRLFVGMPVASVLDHGLQLAAASWEGDQHMWNQGVHTWTLPQAAIDAACLVDRWLQIGLLRPRRCPH